MSQFSWRPIEFLSLERSRSTGQTGRFSSCWSAHPVTHGVGKMLVRINFRGLGTSGAKGFSEEAGLGTTTVQDSIEPLTSSEIGKLLNVGLGFRGEVNAGRIKVEPLGID